MYTLQRTLKPCSNALRILARNINNANIEAVCANPAYSRFQRNSSQQSRSRTMSTMSSSEHYKHPPKTMLVVNKHDTDTVTLAMQAFLQHVYNTYPDVRVFHEGIPTTPSGTEIWLPNTPVTPEIDLVVTFGGDGTILHASSLFSAGIVPPILSFSMGTLGFLLPFHINDFAQALESVFSGKATILNRMRLALSFYDAEGRRKGKKGDDYQVLNEIALHRGASPHLNMIDVYVDNQFLTEAVSDGLILSTPTGSTAYSLSAGGPIVHPSMSALLLTPISPRSLSFRPLVFPSTSRITFKIGANSRSTGGVSMDGRESHILHPGESVTAFASRYPVPCINRSSIASEDHTESSKAGPVGVGNEDDWVRDINSLLQYNATFRSKALLRRNKPAI